MSFSIDVFRNMLRVQKHRLDDELEIQAETQERISSHCAKLNSRQLELKRGLDVTEALVVATLKDNDAKMSNPIAEKEAKRNSSYTAAWNAYQQARHEHEEWVGLYEAWKSRGFQLKTLADLHHDQYFTISSTTGRAEPREAQEEGLRARMREASARASSVVVPPSPPETPPVRRRPIT